MHTKQKSFVELQRIIISRFAALAIAGVAIFTIPRNFDTSLGETFEMMGFTLLIIAALGRIWCSIYIAGRKDRILCKEGPYSLCRNPLYFFSFVGVAGFALSVQSMFILLIATAGFLFYYRYVIRNEELRLSRLFGDEYAAYLQSVPRFFPKFQSITHQANYPIDLRIIERSLREVVWFLLMIIAAEVLEMVHHHGYLVLVKLPV